MAYYTAETEVSTAVSLDIEVTVQDQDGNEFECDIDGSHLELIAQIDTSKIKDEMMEEVRDDLQKEVHDQYLSDFAESLNPFNELADLMSQVGAAYKIRQERSRDAITSSKASLNIAHKSNFELKTQISRLKDEKDVLDQTVEALQLQVEKLRAGLVEYERLNDERLKSAEQAKEEPYGEFGNVHTPTVHELKIHLDPPKEDK